MGATERGFWAVPLTIDPFRFESGAGTLPVDGFDVWGIVVTCAVTSCALTNYVFD